MRVVHRHEVRIHEADPDLRIRRHLQVTHLIPHQPADGDAAREWLVINVEKGERIQVAGNHVRLIKQSVERVPRRAERIAQRLVLIGVRVGAEVGLDVAPRERGDDEPDVGDQPVGLRIELVLGDVVVRVVELRSSPNYRHQAPGTRGREIIPRVIILRPQHQAHQRADVAFVYLIVVHIGVDHRQVGGQPGVDPSLGGSGDVGATVTRAAHDPFLLIEGSAQPVIDRVVGRRSTKREIVVLAEPGPQESVEIVVESGAGGIWGAKILERSVRAADVRRQAIDSLERVSCGRPFGPHAGTVLHSATQPAALGLDDDCAVGCVDAVQRGGLRSFQDCERFDVLRIQVGRAVAEVHAPVAERGGRVLIRREQRRIDGAVVDRQTIHDDQRLIAAADRADAADDDRRRRARYARRAGDIDAGHAAREGVEEVLPLRLRDLNASDALLRGPQRPRGRVFAQRRHHHGIEIQRHPPQLDVDDVLCADRPLRQRRPDEPELQHLAGSGGNRVVALRVCGCRGGGAFDGD